MKLSYLFLFISRSVYISNYAFGMRFKREKTVQETYNSVLQGLPLLH